MKQIYRISAAAILAAASAFVLAPAASPAFGQTTGKLTCQPASVVVGPSATVASSLDVTCSLAASGGGGTSCALSPLSQQATGGAATVTATNCGTSPTWTISGTGASVAASSSSATTGLVTVPLPAAAQVTYTVTATDPNNASSTGTASATVTVPASTSTGGGGGGGITCGTPVTLPWSAAGYSRTTVVVSGSGVSVGVITVPAGAKSINSSPKVVLSNSAGSAKYTWALASAPCSFPTGTDPVIGGPGAMTNLGTYDYFQLSGTASPWMSVLVPGNTYYVNVKNATGSGSNTIYLDLYN